MAMRDEHDMEGRLLDAFDTCPMVVCICVCVRACACVCVD